MELTEKTQRLLVDRILPSWGTTIRRYERDGIASKEAARIMATSVREIQDYAVGILHTMSWNAINYLKEAIIPLETEKILLGNEYYSKEKGSAYYDDSINELKAMADQVRKAKKRTYRGSQRHYDMWGRETSIVPND